MQLNVYENRVKKQKDECIFLFLQCHWAGLLSQQRIVMCHTSVCHLTKRIMRDWTLCADISEKHSRNHTVESLCGPSVSNSHLHTHRRGLWTVWRLPLLSLWCLSTFPACSRASHSGHPRWVTLPRRDDSVDCQKPSQHHRGLGAPHSQHAVRLPDDSWSHICTLPTEEHKYTHWKLAFKNMVRSSQESNLLRWTSGIWKQMGDAVGETWKLNWHITTLVFALIMSKKLLKCGWSL